MKKLVIALFVLLFWSYGYCTDYHIGPGQTYENLGDFEGWRTLVAGDIVYIHYREAPYAEKIGIRAQGEQASPVRVVGVLGPNGERPHLTGENATTDNQFAGFFSAAYTEDLGLIYIYRALGDPYGTFKPRWISIENLKITGVKAGNFFTTMAGTQKEWNRGAAPVRVQAGDDITVKNCELTDSGNGLFVMSKSEAESEMSRRIMVDGNYIHGNGTLGGDRQHNIYTQAAQITFQNNRIGKLRPTSLGAALKDRSAGTIIRYNWIESGGGMLDLVDPQDSASLTMADPSWGKTWVYGNILINDFSDAALTSSRAIVHYGGDSGSTLYNQYRKGIMYFYNNTVYFKANTSQVYYGYIFKCDTLDESVDVRNNIFYRNGTMIFYLSGASGIINVTGKNWISEGYTPKYPGSAATVNIFNTQITGSFPGMVDINAYDFRLTSDSGALSKASELPVEITSSNPVSFTYIPHMQTEARASLFDLGAYENGSGGPPPTGATLTSISISGPSSILENSSGEYQIIATMSDGSTKNVSLFPETSFSDASGDTTITQNVVAVGSISGNTTTTLNAQYVEGGVTKTAQLLISLVDNVVTAPGTVGNIIFSPGNGEVSALGAGSGGLEW